MTTTDSLWVSLQQLASQVPGLVWSTISSLFIAFVVYRLARRSFRSGHWWEAQAKAYSDVVEEFLTIAHNIEKVAAYDAWPGDQGAPDSPYNHEQAQAFLGKAKESQEAIRKQIKRGGFLLSPRAVRLLEAYVREVKNIRDDASHITQDWKSISARYHKDFYDLARVDLGTARWLPWKIRRGWRWLQSWRRGPQ